MTKGLEERVKTPKNLEPKDKIRQMMVNERYDIFILLESGRMFKARARGHSGSYDPWYEIDLISEIKSDLHI